MLRNRLDKPITITITKSAKQVDACIAIAKELPDYFTEQGVRDMSRDLQKNPSYVAVSSNETVGFVAIIKKSKHVAEILWMAVKPENQRRGIGSALVGHLAKELGSQGIKLLEVKTLATHADLAAFERTYGKTRRFYEKTGFIHLDTIDPYPAWEPGNPCAIYVKVL